MRALKALVVIMGVIIVIGVIVVGVTIFNRLSKPAAPLPTANVVTPAPVGPAVPPAPSPASLPIGTPLPPHFDRKFGDVTVSIPAGARVADFSVSGDRLVLRVVMPDQEQRLVVVDLITGAQLGTIRLASDAGSPGANTAGNPGGSVGAVQPSLLTPVPTINVPPRNKSEGLK